MHKRLECDVILGVAGNRPAVVECLVQLMSPAQKLAERLVTPIKTAKMIFPRNSVIWEVIGWDRGMGDSRSLAGVLAENVCCTWVLLHGVVESSLALLALNRVVSSPIEKSPHRICVHDIVKRSDQEEQDAGSSASPRCHRVHAPQTR